MHFCNGYIYLIYIREYLLQGLPIYKIGLTTDLIERLRQYPKGSMYIYTCYCENISITENHIKKIFIDLFHQRRDLGIEYFEGNIHQMVSIIHTHVQLDFINQKYFRYPCKIIYIKNRIMLLRSYKDNIKHTSIKKKILMQRRLTHK